MILGRTTATLATGGLLVVLAACSGRTLPGPTTTVTVPAPTPSAASSGTTSSASAAQSSSASATSAAPSASSSTVAAMTALPGRCDGLLPLGSIVDAVGHSVGGATAFVVGTADPTIGRVSYLNCRYGVDATTQVPTIEIGVSLYRTDAQAAARIQPTIDEYTQHAATATSVTVSGTAATELDGGVGAEYPPTLVLAVGQRTVAVSIRAGSSPAATIDKDLATLAALAVDRTGSGG